MNKLIISFALLFLQVASYAQNVGIGTNSPDSSALLELNSNSKGFLPPRMTTNEKNAIVRPANGLVIFNTTTNCLEMYVYNKWQNVFCGVADSTTNVDSTLLTDIDGHTYPTTKICNQTWMAKNLDVARYRNGDIIPQVTDPTEWANLTTGAWCWYNNDSATYGSVYGRLYNWYAVSDPRGLAPEGWHVPSDGEWNVLVKCLDANADTTCQNCSHSSTAGGELKSTTGWNITGNGTNSSGFTGLPGGNRNSNNGTFNHIVFYASWWSSSEYSTSSASYHELSINDGGVYNGIINKAYGFSVRCVKDTPITTLNDGLVAYYPFNGNANDESGNGNNGVVNGATLSTDRFGNSGKAYSFDGNDDYIVCVNNNIPVYSNQTVSFYAKFNSFRNWPDGSEFICLGSDASTSWGILEYSNGNSTKSMGRGCNGEGGSILNNVFSINTWCHYSFVTDFTLGITKIYKNSILIGQTINGTVNGNCSQSNLYFGVDIYSFPEYFNGQLDEIRIYNRVLTQEEITYLASH